MESSGRGGTCWTPLENAPHPWGVSWSDSKDVWGPRIPNTDRLRLACKLGSPACGLHCRLRPEMGCSTHEPCAQRGLLHFGPSACKGP
eukprot:4627673-Alexandrium_andersonii.AAC.1